MLGDAAPPGRFKHFFQPVHSHRLSLPSHKQSSKPESLPLGLLQVKGPQLSRFSTNCFRLGGEGREQNIFGTLHWDIESILLDASDLLVTALSQQPCAVAWDIGTAMIEKNFYWKTRLQGTTLWRKHSSSPAKFTFSFHWNLGGVSQAVRKLPFWTSRRRAPNHSLIFAKSTRGDVMGMQHIGSQADVQSQCSSAWCCSPPSFHCADTMDSGLFLTWIISAWPP